MIKIPRIEIIFFTIIIGILYYFSYAPIIANFKAVPNDLYYYGSTDYPIDMLGNMTTMREGELGHWQRTPKVTSTIEGKPTYVKLEYILIGQLARITGIDALAMFYIVRTVISFAFLIFLYILVVHIFTTSYSRIIAYALVIFGTGIHFPWQNWSIIHQLPLDSLVLQRFTTGANHYMLGNLIALVSLFFLARSLDRPSEIRYFLLASLTGFIASFIFLPTMMLLLLGLPIFLVLRFLQRGKNSFAKVLRDNVMTLFVYGGVSILPTFYLLYVSHFWDFNMLSKTEHLVPFSISIKNYVQAMGLPFILSVLTLPFILREKKTLLMLLVPWVIIHPLMSLFLAPFFHMSSFRFFLTPYYVFFSIIASLGIIRFTRAIHIRRADKILRVTPLVFLIVIFSSSFYAYQVSQGFNTVCFCMVPNVYNYGYPRKDVMEAVGWLRKNTRENDIVLSAYYAGTIIPAFSGNKVYTSWWHRLMEPPNFVQTSVPLEYFFAGNMSNAEAEGFVKEQRIRYVYFGEEEKSRLKNAVQLPYSFLKEVERSGSVIIYAVQS